MVNKLTLPSLDPETRYVARVRAKSRLGVLSDWSEALDFTTPANTIFTPEEPGGGGGSAEPHHTIVVQQPSQLIDLAGTNIQWIEEKPGTLASGFETIALPLTNVVTPEAGFWKIALSFRWDSWRFGGIVRVIVNTAVMHEVIAGFGTGFVRTFSLGALAEASTVAIQVSPGPTATESQTALDLELSLVGHPYAVPGAEEA